MACYSPSFGTIAKLPEQLQATATVYPNNDPSHMYQTARCLTLPSGLQLANRHLRRCHNGAAFVRTHFTTLLKGGKTLCHIPPSNSTLSMFNRKTGRTLKTKLNVTDFLPASKAILTISIGVLGVLYRESATIDGGSALR